MKSKKFLTVILAVAILVLGLGSFTGCSSNSGKLKVGVILYNYTDVQGKEMQSYCKYLEKHFDVQFEYESVGSNDEDHISGLENLLSKGCKAIISGYDTALSSSIKKAAAAKAYYVVALGDVSQYEYLAENGYQPTLIEGMDSEYFLGGTMQFGGDAAAVGEAYAEAAYAAQLKKIGAISFPTYAFSDGQVIYNSFKSTLEDLDPSVEIYELQTFLFTQAACEDVVNTLLTDHPDVQGVLGLGSGLDYIYPILQNRNSSAKLLALGYNDTVETLFASGQLLTAGTNNYSQIVASCFARIWDASNGLSYADRTDDDINAVAGYPLILSASEIADFKTYVIPADKSKGSVTVDELKNVMVSFNESATWAELNALTSRTLGQIKQARA